MEHGTVNSYKNRGCRCPECREAGSVYAQERRDRAAVGLITVYHAGGLTTDLPTYNRVVRRKSVARSITLTPKARAYLASMKERNVA